MRVSLAPFAVSTFANAQESRAGRARQLALAVAPAIARLAAASPRRRGSLHARQPRHLPRRRRRGGARRQWNARSSSTSTRRPACWCSRFPVRPRPSARSAGSCVAAPPRREGFLTRSTNGRFVVFPGYDAAVGTASITTSTSATVPRVIGRVAAERHDRHHRPRSPTRSAAATRAAPPRPTAPTSGSREPAPAAASATRRSARRRRRAWRRRRRTCACSVSSAASSTPARRAAPFVSPPSAPGRRRLPDRRSPTCPGSRPRRDLAQAYFFADLDAGVAGVDTVYVADDGGTIQKYSLVAGSWTANGTIALATARGITGTVSRVDGHALRHRRAPRCARSPTPPATTPPSPAPSRRWRPRRPTRRCRGSLSCRCRFSPTSPSTTSLRTRRNAGTTTFTFTVSLSAPAGPGGVTFDIATADGTAQDDNPVAEDNDYVAKSLTGQTIPAGSSTYTFDVTVNGDVAVRAQRDLLRQRHQRDRRERHRRSGSRHDPERRRLRQPHHQRRHAERGQRRARRPSPSPSAFSPAGCGGVTFDIATADGTAQDDNPATEDNDYVAQSLTGQTVTHRQHLHLQRRRQRRSRRRARRDLLRQRHQRAPPTSRSSTARGRARSSTTT